MKPTDGQIEDFINRLQAGGPLQNQDAEIVRYLLVTITAQAEVIAKLSFRLDVMHAFSPLASDAIASSGISKLQQSLGNPQRNDFTVQEARDRIDSVLQEIQNQNQVTEVLSSIAKFAIKFAPLLLA